jgi:beta-lactamase regulating signal transducer with metallopeptidase domain
MSNVLDVVAWLATYLLHSTVVLGLALLATRALRQRPDWAAAVWRVAIAAPLLTTAAGGFVAVSNPVVVTSTSASSAVRPARAWASGSGTLRLDTAPVVADPEVRAPVVAPRMLRVPHETMTTARPASSSAEPVPVVIGLVLALLWLGAVAYGVLGLARARWGLSRTLAEQQRIQGGPFWELFHALRSRSRATRRARLVLAPRVEVPMVLGSTVYVPPRVLEGLDRSAQFALLAHELGHLAHGDPRWRWLSLALERVFWFQPLHRIAARELAAASELLADAWAAQQTREPLELARCLTEVAGWMSPRPRLGPAPTASEPRSILARRVHSLVAYEAAGSTPSTGPRWQAPAVAAVVMVLGLAMPRVVSGHDRQDSGEVHMAMASLPAVIHAAGVSAGEVVVVDDAVVVDSREQPVLAGQPPTRRQQNRQRREAKKRVRKAFRDAKRRGEAHPTPAELHRAVTGEDPPEAPQPLVIIIDGDRVEITEGPPAWGKRKKKHKHKKRKKHEKHEKHAKGPKHPRHPFDSGPVVVRVRPPGHGGHPPPGHRMRPNSEQEYAEAVQQAERMRSRMLAEAQRQRAEAQRQRAEAERNRERVLRETDRMLRKQQRELEQQRKAVQRELEKQRKRKQGAETEPRPSPNDLPF